MNCAEFESTLADYVDGTLGAPERAAVEAHTASCLACGEFMAEVTGAVTLLKRVEEVEPPAELITRIAFQTPQGRTRPDLDLPGLSNGFWAELRAKWLEPLLQPRLAMGMAMTVLSFSMLARCTGVPVQHLSAADLNPGHVLGNLEDRVLRTKDRFVKNYENLRVVYEIESRLNEMDRQNPNSGTSAEHGKQQDRQGGKK
jgi:anti-sigma factor RsiW